MTEQEIKEVYERYVDMVYRICFAYLKNIYDTQDAVQDTFVKLMKYKKEFQSEEHRKAWLIVTSSNLCKDRLKHWWNRRENIAAYESIEGTPGLEVDETLQAVLSLPALYKITVYLYYYEGYTTDEIAKILRKPGSTVRNRLSQARKMLRKKLEGEK